MENQKYLIQLLTAISNAMIEAEAELTKLDSALGDGDCGHGMKNGFKAVLEILKEDCTENMSVSGILKKTAMTLISAVGGTSGAIYGTGFMKMANTFSKASEINTIVVVEALIAFLDGAKMRGEDTKVGDKTLIDALEPAVYAFKKKIEAGCSVSESCAAATEAAQKGSDSTISLIAKRAELHI